MDSTGGWELPRTLAPLSGTAAGGSGPVTAAGGLRRGTPFPAAAPPPRAS